MAPILSMSAVPKAVSLQKIPKAEAQLTGSTGDPKCVKSITYDLLAHGSHYHYCLRKSCLRKSWEPAVSQYSSGTVTLHPPQLCFKMECACCIILDMIHTTWAYWMWKDTIVQLLGITNAGGARMGREFQLRHPSPGCRQLSTPYSLLSFSCELGFSWLFWRSHIKPPSI